MNYSEYPARPLGPVFLWPAFSWPAPPSHALLSTVLLWALLVFYSNVAIAQASSSNGVDWLHSADNTEEGVPAGLITNKHSAPYLLWVEMDTGLLHLLERTGEQRYLRRAQIPMSIGKKGYGKEVEGDEKTPIGVYRITSFLKDEELDDFYGLGAYPINYPNTWDRLNQRTGHGIWLHGLPKGQDKRPLRDSRGCVVIDNSILTDLADYIDTGESLMVLSASMNWLPVGTSQPDGDVLDAIESWKNSWEDNRIGDYLSNYHQEFTDFRRNLTEWKTYKTRVNGAKSWIKVGMSDLTVFDYPGEEGLVVSRFYQNYESSNYRWSGWKQLLWRRDTDGNWRILYEGNG